MTKKPLLVSIVIPVYNHENYLTACLDSVFNQTYPHIEVLIIDDGSKDNSVRIVEDYLKKREQDLSQIKREVTLIKQQNAGAHTTINTGLSLAKGDFLTILNSDDYYHPERIQILVDKVAAKGDLGFTLVTGIDDHGNSLAKSHPWCQWYEQVAFDVINWPTIGFKLLQDNLAVSTGNLFFSKALYKRVGPFKNLKLAHDLDFILRALVLTEPILVEQKLYFYRIHSSNSFQKLHHVIESEFTEIYRDYLSLVSSKPPENSSAPCHWHWPLLFPFVFQKNRMERGFVPFLSQQDKNSTSCEKEVPKQLSMLKNLRRGSKITLITHELTLSGAPKVVADLALSLKNAGYAPHVLALEEGPMRAEIEKHGIPCSVIPSFLSNWAFQKNLVLKLFSIGLLLSYLLAKTGRIVICNTAPTWRTLVPLTIFSPFKKMFWYIHESFSPSTIVPQGFSAKFIAHAQKNSKLSVLFGSKSTQEIWKEAGVGGTVHYWSGISQKTLATSHQRSSIKKLLSVGTISPRKGTHYLIEAFMYAIAHNWIEKDVTLTIVGLSSSPLYYSFNNELMLKIVGSHLQDRIKIIPIIAPDALDKFYEEADLFVQSSVLECLPISLLSAMARGLPIVTTDANGCVEVVENNKTGYICPSRDVMALAETLTHAIQNTHRTKQMGKDSQAFFNEKLCLEENEKTFLKLLNQ